jgi:CRP/FNR family transcriptional regulator, cyclic AMP receptor protein
MTMTSDEKADALGRIALFDGLERSSLLPLAEMASEEDFSDGDALVIQGQVGTGLFVVVRGAVRVVLHGEDVARLGPGDYLGELAVIDRQPRSASAFAVGPTTCLALASWDLFRRIDADPALSHALLRGLALRVRTLSDHLHH